MEKLLEILKSLTTNLAEGLQELKDSNVEQAVEKITSVVDLVKEATTEAEAVKAEADEDKETLEKTKADNLAIIEKIASNADALQVIEKWVNLGISGDKMEAVLSDIKALQDALNLAGGTDALLKSLTDQKETAELVEKIAKKVSVSKQVKGDDDEEDDDTGKQPVAKFKSFRGAFNRANGYDADEDDDGDDE
mgnify:FL=1